ncbi:MAG: hypothetical protein LBS15_02450 [Endomicrobium sp.]|nr:hypothetical protein [Endomicrobium sp.]
MFSLEIVGFFAGCVSTISFVPQVYKTRKTKSAEEISIEMFIIYTISLLLWIIYGKTLKKTSNLCTEFISSYSCFYSDYFENKI